MNFDLLLYHFKCETAYQIRLRRNDKLSTRECRFWRARFIVGTRHCRVLISGYINSDATGIDIRQGFTISLTRPPHAKIYALLMP